jgi:hypothetical protein
MEFRSKTNNKLASAKINLMPYSKLKLNTPELQELARQKLVQTIKANPKLSMQASWDKSKAENPKLLGDLQAADWMADDEAEERERQETHGSFQPSAPGAHQFSLAEHKALFDKLRGPKKVEATHQEGIICVGGFSNPLF